ncbi:MAG: FG-GAP-like repeat-containing protein, partial [Deltaproteobacteria bacterium]
MRTGARFTLALALLAPSVAIGQSTAPRLLAPAPSSTLTTARPALRAQLGPGGQLTVCRDRAMRRACTLLQGERPVLARDLAAGVWYWQGLTAAGGRTAVWPFVVARGRTPTASRVPSVDFDGDGFADLAAAATRNRLHGASGEVEIFRGSSRGLSVRPGRALRGVSPDDHYGSYLAAADVNGDGVTDLVVGAPEATVDARRGSGLAHVFLGGRRGILASPALRLTGDAEFEGLGLVARTGDVNGDGYEDVAIGGLHGSSAVPALHGQVGIHLGGPQGLAATAATVLVGDSHAHMFGLEVAAGDFDGDGFADLAAGDPFASRGGERNGSVSVFRGGASGVEPSPAWVLVGQSDGDGFGGSLAAGDVNGDGFADLLIGAPTRSMRGSAAGAVYVHFGSVRGLSTRAAEVLEGGQSSDTFGWRVACADLDGDGRDDAVITAPGATGAAPAPGTPVHAAFALVYRAGATGALGGDAPVRLEGTIAGDLFGKSVAALDVNGDGRPEVLVGSALAAGSGDDPFGFVQVYTSVAGAALGATSVARLRGAVSGDLLGTTLAH